MDEYNFPHYIVIGYIAIWTVVEIIAVLIWPIRQSCKKVSLLHCIIAFLLSSVWLVIRCMEEWTAGRISIDADPSEHLHSHSVPGTLEHHVVSLSMAYFIVDTPFALTFHRAFIVHHVICILAFAAIQGYWRYIPESWPFFMDFMTWDTTPKADDPASTRTQLLMGGTNGVFNLWMAELGGVFFHINRAMAGTDLELPSRGMFLLMFSVTRLGVWPTYLYHVYASAARTGTAFHKVSMVLETGLFLTNINFLYKNISPVWATGRLIPDKPQGFHRKWLDQHPLCQRICGLFLRKEKIMMDMPAVEVVSKED